MKFEVRKLKYKEWLQLWLRVMDNEILDEGMEIEDEATGEKMVINNEVSAEMEENKNTYCCMIIDTTYVQVVNPTMIISSHSWLSK